MCRVYLTLIVCLMACPGCSTWVVSCGTNPRHLQTKEQVHETFGEPLSSGEADGSYYEDYFSHRKIAEPWMSEVILMCDGITFGFAEFLWFPHELYVSACRAITGEHLRFTYDVSGKVTQITLDGHLLGGPTTSLVR